MSLMHTIRMETWRWLVLVVIINIFQIITFEIDAIVDPFMRSLLTHLPLAGIEGRVHK